MFRGIKNDTSYSTPAQQAKGLLTSLEKKMWQITPPGWHAKRLTPPHGVLKVCQKGIFQIQTNSILSVVRYPLEYFFIGWVMWMWLFLLWASNTWHLLWIGQNMHKVIHTIWLLERMKVDFCRTVGGEIYLVLCKYVSRYLGREEGACAWVSIQCSSASCMPMWI